MFTLVALLNQCSQSFTRARMLWKSSLWKALWGHCHRRLKTKIKFNIFRQLLPWDFSGLASTFLLRTFNFRLEPSFLPVSSLRITIWHYQSLAPRASEVYFWVRASPSQVHSFAVQKGLRKFRYFSRWLKIARVLSNVGHRSPSSFAVQKGLRKFRYFSRWLTIARFLSNVGHWFPPPSISSVVNSFFIHF